MKRVALLVLISSIAACEGSTPPATTPPPLPPPSTASAPPSASAAPIATEPPPAPEPAPVASAPPPAASTPEACDESWVCVKIPLAGGKLEKRTTRILGDSHFTETLSQTTDGRRPGTFDVGGKHVEVSLRQKAGVKPKSEVVLRIAPADAPTKLGPENVVDSRDAGTFSYVGMIAAEDGGAFVLDVKYMK